MYGLGNTLAKLRKRTAMPRWESLAGVDNPITDRLTDLASFGSNPGALHARTYLPENLKPGAALVVVLHGCTQSAAAYDHGSGWSQLADENGFALLFPEQDRANNPNLCFNWFSPVDAKRGSGEPQSISQMIAAMVKAHDLDQARIHVTGLSAGGAMASIMLATYPELFAGGAIIAGLPFGHANSVADAFARMSGNGYPSSAELGAFVRAASSHTGPWPKIAVWHGTADATVDHSNADRIINQWQVVHGLKGKASAQSQIAGHKHRVWKNTDGEAQIEAYEISGMGHGTPLDTSGDENCGASGPYMLDVGISSTRHIAASWGLAPEKAAKSSKPNPDPAPTPAPPSTPQQTSVGAVIENALRAAGLMK